ncbi:F-box/LRR-repeat protein 7 [Lachancea thermotolerans]
MRAFKARHRSSRRKSGLSRQISSVEAARGDGAQRAREAPAAAAPATAGAVATAPPPPAPPKLLLDKLTSFSLFQDAPPSFFAQIAHTLKLVTHHSQEYIIKAGEPAKAMYWILRGSVNVTSPDGETVHAQLLEGAYFGEIGILFNRPRTATIVANTRVLLGVLTAENLNQVLPDFPTVERQIRDEAQERLAMQDKKIKSGVASLLTASVAWSGGAGTGGSQSHSDGVSPGAPSSHPTPPPPPPPALLDDSISIRQFLQSLPLFSTLPPEVPHRLALCVEFKQTQPYEYIFRSGEEGSSVYFIVSGEVEVLAKDPNDLQEKVLARVGPGQIFGECEIFCTLGGDLSHHVRFADVRSVSSCTLLVLPGETLNRFCHEFSQIGPKLRMAAEGRKAELFTPLLHESACRKRRASDDTLSAPSSKESTPVSDLQPSNGTISTTPFSPVSFNPKFSFNPAPSRPALVSVPSRATSPAACPDEPLELHVPPMNSVTSSVSFKIQHPAPLHYMSHRKRARLSSIGQGPNRRKSSVLSVGPLPDRLLLRCFQFLSLPELMKLRLVCRRWRQLLYVAPGLFEVLDLTSWSNSIDDKSLIEITNFVGSRPKVIDVSRCFHVTDEGFSYMINEIGINGQLQVVKMQSCWEISAMAIMDIAAPSIGSSIEEIDLTNCRKVKDDVVQRLLGCIEPTAGNPRPKDDFNSWIYPLDEPIPGMEALDSPANRHGSVGCPNLKKLSLRYCKSLTDSTLHHIALRTRQTLTTLDLTRCTGLTDVGFSYWGYQNFANLEKLVLSECTFLTDNSIRWIANCAPRIRELYLSFCCSLKDTALEFLWLGCPGLEILDLSFCGRAVSDISLLGLSMHLRKLQRISLKGCLRVTRSGLDSLLCGFTSLTYIDISQCKNAHMYQGGIEAVKFEPTAGSRSVFLTMEDNKDRCVEVVI